MTDRSYEIPQGDLRILVRVVTVCTFGPWAFAAGLLIRVAQNERSRIEKAQQLLICRIGEFISVGDPTNQITGGLLSESNLEQRAAGERARSKLQSPRRPRETD
jgi:hypothetical protein